MNEALGFDPRRNGSSIIQEIINRFQKDLASLSRSYQIEASDRRRVRMEQFYSESLATVLDVNFEALDDADRVDFVLFKSQIVRFQSDLELRARWFHGAKQILTFADEIIELDENRTSGKPIDAAAAANKLATVAAEIKALIAKDPSSFPTQFGFPSLHLAKELAKVLTRWFTYYDGYDPEFCWWIRKPYAKVTDALNSLIIQLEAEILVIKHEGLSEIVGHAVGREAIVADLLHELIPYTPEELIEVGEREYRWCEAEMQKASQELGFGENWRSAVEYVKGLHVSPGKQPELVRALAEEAVAFLEANDLVTVPELAKETWRMQMMSAEAQKVNPFFLGGEAIIVSFPTDEMSHEEKLMSLRGNNRHFSRATVQHELIPGHHLQFFMLDRFRSYRELFGTPFWIEGWALHWEMLLWDANFATRPEDRIGMLFWRMHRCVRIAFSLKFHLGLMSAQECVETLIDRVGHERANAEGEVRRSFNGAYPPLYQAAYMIGGLQFRRMYQELVGTGKMTSCEFHDAVLRENRMPVAILREVLRGHQLLSTGPAPWRFLE